MNWRQFLNRIANMLVAGVSTGRGRIDDDSKDVLPVASVRTLHDEIKDRWPQASQEAMEELLWLTPYPAGSRDAVVASLSQMRERWGPKIGDAIAGENAEFDRMWKEHRERTAGT